jgi:hypothetical protein
MKSYIIAIGLAMSSLSLSAQTSGDNANTSTEKAQVPEIITKLKVKETLKIDEYQLSFKSVSSDGRCPEKVTCVWPGEAKVLVEIFDGTDIKSKTITIPALGFHEEIFTTSEHVVYLKNLAPYPVTSKDDIKAYQLLLKVQAINL